MRNVRTEELRPDKRVSRLIGRLHELQVLEHLLQQGVAGKGSVAVLSGDIGVGKTRLLTAAMVLARANKTPVHHVVTSRVEGSLAFQPLVRLLNSSLSSKTESHRHLLRAKIPDVARVLPHAEGDDPPPISDPTLEKKRIFDALLRLLHSLSKEAPQTFFWDDFHYSDPYSIEFVRYLGEHIQSMPLCIVIASRSLFSPALSAARITLDELLQPVGIVSVPIVPLARQESLEYIRSLLDVTFDRSTIASLLHQSRGIPLQLEFFVSRCTPAPHYDLTGWVHPWSDALQSLSPLDAQMFDWIAAHPLGAPSTCLTKLPDFSTAAVGLSLRKLINVGLIDEGTDRSSLHYIVRHRALRLLWLEQKPELCRVILHARWVELLARNFPHFRQRLAFHAWEARSLMQWEELVNRLDQAGQECKVTGALNCAEFWLQRAVEQCRLLPASPLTQRIALDLAQLKLDLKQPRQSIPLANSVLDSPSVDSISRARACSILAGSHALLSNPATQRTYLEQGLELLRQEPASPLALSLCIELELKHPAARAWSFGSNDDPGPAAERLERQALRLQREGRLVPALEAAEQAVQLAARAPLPRLRLSANLTLAAICLCGGLVEKAREIASDVHSIANFDQEIRLQTLAYEIQTIADWLLGHWSEAEERLRQYRRVETSADPAIPASFYALHALLHVYQGEHEAAELELDHAWTSLDSDWSPPSTRPMLLAVGAILARDQYHLETALDLMAQLESDDRVSHAPYLSTLLLALRANIFAHGQKLDLFEPILRELRRRDIGNGYAVALADGLEGLRLGTIGLAQEAAPFLRRSALSFDRLNLRQDAALTRLVLLEFSSHAPHLLIEAGEADSCTETFRELHAQRYLARAEKLRLGLHHRVAKPNRTRTGLLSDREREIATLVAQGLTNDEIGSRLFISTHTVSTHLRRLFERLKLRSRTELATYIIEHRLLRDTRAGLPGERT